MTMRSIMICKVLLLLLCLIENANAQAIPANEKICGKWESTAKNLRIRIYMDHHQYKAILIWFGNTGGKPMGYWTDINNPDPALRKRKLLGISILSGLTYDSETDSWENGLVYDSTHGRDWNASAYIGKKGQLHVRGYWHFKFIGKTMSFHRI